MGVVYETSAEVNMYHSGHDYNVITCERYGKERR